MGKCLLEVDNLATLARSPLEYIQLYCSTLIYVLFGVVAAVIAKLNQKLIIARVATTVY
jgi:hypothetical protein